MWSPSGFANSLLSESGSYLPAPSGRRAAPSLLAGTSRGSSWRRRLSRLSRETDSFMLRVCSPCRPTSRPRQERGAEEPESGGQEYLPTPRCPSRIVLLCRGHVSLHHSCFRAYLSPLEHCQMPKRGASLSMSLVPGQGVTEGTPGPQRWTRRQAGPGRHGSELPTEDVKGSDLRARMQAFSSRTCALIKLRHRFF